MVKVNVLLVQIEPIHRNCTETRVKTEKLIEKRLIKKDIKGNGCWIRD